jgi:hypothetical protein
VAKIRQKFENKKKLKKVWPDMRGNQHNNIFIYLQRASAKKKCRVFAPLKISISTVSRAKMNMILHLSDDLLKKR